MRHNLFIVIVALLTISACSSGKKAQSGPILQGIAGVITEIKGNQMPMKGAIPDPGRPVKTKIFIYEPTNIAQVQQVGASPLYTTIHTKLVASAESDSTGAYHIALEPGTYSVFVQQGKQFFANLFDEKNNIQLVTVEANKVTSFNITINSNAVY